MPNSNGWIFPSQHSAVGNTIPQHGIKYIQDALEDNRQVGFFYHRCQSSRHSVFTWSTPACTHYRLLEMTKEKKKKKKSLTYQDMFTSFSLLASLLFPVILCKQQQEERGIAKDTEQHCLIRVLWDIPWFLRSLDTMFYKRHLSWSFIISRSNGTV